MDFDVVILNGTKLREMQEKAKCVLGINSDQCIVLCIGFFSCAPNSTFIQDWLYKSYEGDYKPTSWAYNSGHAPSHILRACPNCYDVYVDQYISNWENVRFQKWLTPGATNWTTKAVAHYMNAGFMKPLRPAHELLRMNTPFTDMIKYVLGDTYREFL